jgi:hypothetical protein
MKVWGTGCDIGHLVAEEKSMELAAEIAVLLKSVKVLTEEEG